MALYMVILFLLMTFYRLPADRLIAATVENLSGGRLLLGAQKVTRLFPPRYKLEEVSYGIFSGDALSRDSFRSLILGPDYRGLFMGYLPLEIKATMPRGSLNGRMGVSITRGVQNSYLMIKTDDLFLEDLGLLGPFLKRDIKGRLKGEIRVKGNLTDHTKITGRGQFHAEKGSIGTRIDLPGMERISFESVKLGFSIKDGILALDQSNIDGPMLSGNLSGEIKWHKKVASSRLNITAKIRPGPLLENNQLTRQFLKKVRKGNNPVIIKIRGTLERPSINWSKG